MVVLANKKLKKFIILISILGVFSLSLFFLWKNFDSLYAKIESIYDNVKFYARIVPLFGQSFPERLINTSLEIKNAGEDLLKLNDKLVKLADECDCKFVQSECKQNQFPQSCSPGNVKTFGDPCQPNRNEITKTQKEVKRREDQLTFLDKLIKVELEWGLPGELLTLAPEQAQNIKNNIESLSQPIQKINELSEKVTGLFPSCSAPRCQPACETGMYASLEACINPGEEKPGEVVLKGGVKLQDLDLGTVKIENIKLNLPEKITFNALGEISPLEIPLPDIVINFPEVKVNDLQKNKTLKPLNDTFTFTAPSPPIPTKSPLDFIMSSPVGQSFQCQGNENQTSSYYYSDADWYFQTISWLSQKCQSMNEMEEQLSTSSPEYVVPKPDADKCLNSSAVLPTIINICSTPVSSDPLLFSTSSICLSMGRTCYEKAQAIERECRSLFNQLREPVPSSCKISSVCNPDLKLSYCGGKDYCYATTESVNNALGTLKDKCEQLKQEGRKTEPLPCKYLALFTGKLTEPSNYQGSNLLSPCLPQTITDFPENPLSGYNPLPSVPKIVFPPIKIPDISLPSFSFFPFFQVKLPKIIFEDLVLPELKLCDLDQCTDIFNIFPDINLKIPHLAIPRIELPSIELPDIEVNLDTSVVGIDKITVPPPEIKMHDITFPNIKFSFNQPLNLNNIISPEITLPTFALPQPEFYFEFGGFKISAGIADFIAMIIQNALGFSIPSGCISVDFHIAPLMVNFPDFYFTFPKFPKILEIPFCDDISDFCKKMADKLQPVLDLAEEIQDDVNNTIDEEIQTKLDKLSEKVNEYLKEYIEHAMKLKIDTIRIAIKNHVEVNAKVENGVLKVPPLTIPLGVIKTEPINLEAMASLNLVAIKKEIPIKWREKLKKIQKLTQPIEIQLPPIPLSELSYQKTITLKIVGLQSPSLSINPLSIEKYSSCASQSASGGNPCLVVDMQNVTNQINQQYQTIEQSISKVIDILK